MLTFHRFLKFVFTKITLEVELKHRKFRKKEILTPAPVAPWRGVRLGLNLLLKNVHQRIDKKKRLRKHKFLYNVLDELWDTQNNTSVTCKNILEFTTNVLNNAENYRSTKLFPVKRSRRLVFRKTISPSKLIRKSGLRVFRKKKKKRKCFGRARRTRRVRIQNRKKTKKFRKKIAFFNEELYDIFEENETKNPLVTYFFKQRESQRKRRRIFLHKNIFLSLERCVAKKNFLVKQLKKKKFLGKKRFLKKKKLLEKKYS